MEDRSSRNSRTTHLDATGLRNVVYCHQCEQEWWEDEFGLECPHCEGNITEIVTPGADDPRGLSALSEVVSSTPQNVYSRSWMEYSSDSADSEEINVDGLGGNSSVIVRTFRNPNPQNSSSQIRDSRDGVTGNETRHVLTDFRNMISGLLGPQFRNSVPGRSGAESLFNEPNIQTRTFRIGGNGPGNTFVGGRIIVTNTSIHGGNPLQPRNANEPQSGGAPQVDDIVTLISSILAPTMSNGSAGFGFGDENNHHIESTGSQTGSSDFQAGPPSFQALLSTMLNPRNARSGDAVYSQEALDEILTTLMEQAASNAPGPASPEAIAALPRIKLDTKLLGNEGKGECSICMDEVKLGDEVIILPCKHWFDEACVTAWLKEHNTCPICRKGITEDSSSSNTSNSRDQNSSTGSQNVNRQSRRGPVRTLFLRREPRNRNEDSTNSSRTTDERSQRRRSPRGHERDDNLASMPGSFPADDTENRPSERTGDTRRSSNARSSGNISRSSTFHRIRGLHDRLNNNLRNN